MISISKKMILSLILLLTITFATTTDPNCLKAGNNGQCVLCNRGLVAFNGKCIESVLPCLDYTPSGECAKCELNYELGANKQCTPRSKDCYLW